MPFSIRKNGNHFQVVGPNGVKGTFPTRAQAEAQLRALYANVPEARTKKKK